MSMNALRELSMKSLAIKAWALALAMLTGISAHAADTDVFAGAAPTGADAPYVLLFLDNGASFSASNTDFRCSITAGGVVTTDGTGTAPTNLDQKNAAVEQCALYTVISALATSTTTVNIGIMAFNNTGQKSYDPTTDTFSASCPGNNAGCLIMPIVPINATTKPRILEYIRLWEVSGSGNYNIKGPASLSNGQGMQEAWAYYSGYTGLSGRNYSSIKPGAGCASKHVIYVGNNWATQASPKDTNNTSSLALQGTHATTAVRASPTATTNQLASVQDTLTTTCGTATLDTAENKGAWAMQWGKYMKGQGITTFTVGVLGPSCDVQYGAFLSKLGSTEIGGGKFFSTNNYATLVAAFNTIISEIQSVNSVFAAVSLPVSVNTQGSYLNQVYVGMFRPPEGFLPRWSGNLKQYKLGITNGELRLQDAAGASAINTLTGFITECARSYWTPSAVDTYWASNPSGGCLAITNSADSNYPDGNIVEKGGQAYKLRAITPTARRVKTCSPDFATCSTTSTLTEFSTATAAITQALLNSGGTDRDALINWARGTNVDDELDKGTTVMRPSSHGDVVHSRPVPVNYGTNDAPSIVVFYGANDGMLRAVNGNRGSASDASVGTITSGGNTYGAGAELWSFMPPEFYSKIKRLRDNSVPVDYPTSVVATATDKDYSFDGPITAFQGSIGGSARTLIYATMRRGARSLYAFDVTTPASPTLAWKKGCPNMGDDTGCSTGFDNIGQTWSSLKSIVAAGYGSGTSPMVIMGGGYDACEDYDANAAGGKNHNCAVASTKGNRVFVLDAASGAIVKAFATDRAVVADSTIVRNFSTGLVKYAYTADMGGNVYRISFGVEGVGDPDTWTITKIASLGCDTPAGCTDSVQNRKFMFAPSVVTTDNITYTVMLGSGDREKPVKEYLAAKSVTNYFFRVDDRPSDATWLTSQNATCGANVMCKASLLGILTSATPSTTDLAGKRGWYLGLASTEQVVTSSVTIFGVVTFSTHQPAVTAASACANNLGTTLVYNINYENAASANGTSLRYEDVAGDGLPPSPVAGQVTLDDGTTVPFCIGCSRDSPLEGAPPRVGASVVQPKGRLFWYIQK